MWIKFLYFIWIAIPALFFGFYIIHKVAEKRKMTKSTDLFVIRSKFYIQIAIFCTICSVITFILNKAVLVPLIPKYFDQPYVLETFQLLLYLFVISAAAPFGGKNKAPETLQDKIRNHGFTDERTKKARDAKR